MGSKREDEGGTQKKERGRARKVNSRGTQWSRSCWYATGYRYSGFGSKEPEFRGRNPTLGTPDSHFRRWRICTLGTPDSHFERGRIRTLGTPDSHFGRGRICTLRAPDLQFRRGRICTLGAPDSHFARGQRNPTLRNSGFALQQDL